MDQKTFRKEYLWISSAAILMLWFHGIDCQSCGPRVSARMLAEIPCDMSKSSYCSAPGSAYPWSSVKRYINDNQGLVRRMYGDEKHSSVLLNEIDGFRLNFDQLRSFMGRGQYSRTEYGRSARGHRRQPRPQIFRDDEDDQQPATIFRVVTETSIKVGEPVTRPMTVQTSPAYETATSDGYFEAATPSQTTTTTVSAATETTTTETTIATETTTPSPTTMQADFENDTSATPETTTTTKESTTSAQSTSHDLPVAMQRIGHEDLEEDYDYEPGRKMASALQNSVEEKTKHKDSNDVKRNDPTNTYDQDAEASVYEVVADNDDEGTKKPSSEAPEEKKDEPADEEEEIPRRGINACPVKNEVIAPYWANNTRGETLALLNVHPFEQYVHFEKCAFENHQMLCREGCRCEQQYRLHRLLAFDPKNECRGIFSDWFRFPSCCVCICYDLTPDIPLTRSRRKGRM